MKKLNRIAACAFGMALVIGVSSCSSNVVEKTNISETEITTNSTKEVEESETTKETEITIVETTETAEATETTVEEVVIKDLNEELDKFKNLIVTLSEDEEDMLFSIREGSYCNLEDDNYYLCAYSIKDSALRYYDSDGNFIDGIMNYSPDFWGIYTAEAVLNSPVIMNGHEMGMKGIDNPSHQKIEEFSSEVEDGTYYGTILAVSEDGKKALVSIGEPTIRSEEEIKNIELSEGGWAPVNDGYVWIIEGSGAYYQTGDRVLTILEFANEVEYQGDNCFKSRMTGDYSGNYNEEIIISASNSILDTYFIQYSRDRFKETYDGWVKTYANLSPIVISNGQIISINMN